MCRWLKRYKLYTKVYNCNKKFVSIEKLDVLRNFDGYWITGYCAFSNKYTRVIALSCFYVLILFNKIDEAIVTILIYSFNETETEQIYKEIYIFSG